MDIPNMVRDLARAARAAARQLGNLPRGVKDRVILRVAELLEERRAMSRRKTARTWRRLGPRTIPRPSSTASPCPIR